MNVRSKIFILKNFALYQVRLYIKSHQSYGLVQHKMKTNKGQMSIEVIFFIINIFVLYQFGCISKYSTLLTREGEGNLDLSCFAKGKKGYKLRPLCVEIISLSNNT